MKLKLFILTILLPYTFSSRCQSVGSDCRKVQTGTFYYYSGDNREGLKVIRNDSVQEEINMRLNDTSFWKVNWQNDCECQLKFIRRNRPISDRELSFLNTHLIFIEILKVTNNFYLFRGQLNTIVSNNLTVDTVWFQSKLLTK